MTKTHSLKKQIHGIKKERVLWVVIIALAALLVSTIWYIVKTSSDSADNSTTFSQRPAATEADKERMQAFVNDIEQRRYRYPVIDIKENRVYIPEARMYVPLSEASRDIRYQGQGEEIWLSVAIAVGRQTNDADASCDRVVILTKDENRGRGYIAEGTIKSNDGGTLYIFRHPACEIYGDALSKSLADVAKEIQYY